MEMSKSDQTPARAEASSSKAQAGAEKGKGQKKPPSTTVSGLSNVTTPLNSTPRQRMVMIVLSNLKVLMIIV